MVHHMLTHLPPLQDSGSSSEDYQLRDLVKMQVKQDQRKEIPSRLAAANGKDTYQNILTDNFVTNAHMSLSGNGPTALLKAATQMRPGFRPWLSTQFAGIMDGSLWPLIKTTDVFLALQNVAVTASLATKTLRTSGPAPPTRLLHGMLLFTQRLARLAADGYSPDNIETLFRQTTQKYGYCLGPLSQRTLDENYQFDGELRDLARDMVTKPKPIKTSNNTNNKTNANTNNSSPKKPRAKQTPLQTRLFPYCNGKQTAPIGVAVDLSACGFYNALGSCTKGNNCNRGHYCTHCKKGHSLHDNSLCSSKFP
jgi:hypothetical protein